MDINLAGKRGNIKNLRPPEPGELLPDIVLNDQITEPSKNGKTINQLAVQDSRCHMLLVIGTRLKPQGVQKLVHGMAASVHASGGVVVHVDWTPLAASSWASVFDLHIQMDIEQWAKGCLSALQKVRRFAVDQKYCTNVHNPPVRQAEKQGMGSKSSK